MTSGVKQRNRRIDVAGAGTKVIIALDADDLDQAGDIVRATGDRVGIYKIGSILFTRFGPRALEVAKNAGKEIFLDLKFHDIPNTVKEAVRAAASQGVSLMTVHTSGGADMMAAAREGARAGAEAAGVERPRVIGVTVLTSIAGQDNVLDTVLERAGEAASAGIDGIVCSPREVGRVKQVHGDRLLAVVPGIRLADQQANDQARVGTPGQAAADGADYLVVGRSVTASENPQAMLDRILEEIANA
jgi:orotidine-5'-phosphate decarboxylase